MASIKYTNNAKTTLAADLNNSATSATVVNGNLFPSLSSGEHFYCTFDDGTNIEIVKVTARSTHVLTIVRAQDNTSARAFSSGHKAELRITAVVLEEVSTSTSSWNTDIFAGDGSDTTFTLTQAATDEKYLQVFIDGVFQAHNTYSVSGTTLTFATAPANSRVITAYHIEPVALGTADTITATANNSANETVFPVFVDGATGTQGLETDTGFTYNPSSGVLTIAGELDAGSLDVSGNADIDGTLEADAITVNGVTLAETISDTVGAMVSSNTESGIAVTYDDSDNTLDFTVGTLNQNTTGSAATLTTARAIAVAGDVTGTANFDGSAAISITTTLANDAIVTANITNANVTVAKMAANSVDSDQYVDGSIDTAHIADSQITVAKMAANSVDSDQYVDGSIDTAHIAADQIVASLIADNALDSEHYTDGSIDTAHIADSQITVAKMAANSVDSDQYVDGSIDTAHIADSQITVAKMAANSVDSDQYVDGSIDTAHYADNSITGAELADNIDIAGTFDVTGATTLDSTLSIAGVATAAQSANITQATLAQASGGVTWNALTQANAFFVPSDNNTVTAPGNPVEGAIISVEIAMGSAVKAIAWNTVFEFASSITPTVTATANKTDIFSFRYNGSVWQEIGRVQNLAQT